MSKPHASPLNKAPNKIEDRPYIQYVKEALVSMSIQGLVSDGEAQKIKSRIEKWWKSWEGGKYPLENDDFTIEEQETE